VAIANPANAASIRLLEKLGFMFEHTVRSEDDGPELLLYSVESEPAETGAGEDQGQDGEVDGDSDLRLRQRQNTEQQ